MNRRAILKGAALAPVALLPAQAMASVPDLVEAVMRTVVPYRGGYVAVQAEALQALCEQTGVKWGEHWAPRGRQETT